MQLTYTHTLERTLEQNDANKQQKNDKIFFH